MDGRKRLGRNLFIAGRDRLSAYRNQPNETNTHPPKDLSEEPEKAKTESKPPRSRWISQ